MEEIWGATPRSNPQEGFFSHWNESHQLIDLPPQRLSQTWRNGRKGHVLIAKYLDSFLISKDLSTGPWVLKFKGVVSGLRDLSPTVNSPIPQRSPILFSPPHPCSSKCCFPPSSPSIPSRSDDVSMTSESSKSNFKSSYLLCSWVKKNFEEACLEGLAMEKSKVVNAGRKSHISLA